jgi:iron complex outermembrane receptor protein
VGRRLRLYAGAHLLSTAGNFWFTSDGGTVFDTSHDHEVRRANNAALQADGSSRAVLAIDGGRTLTAAALVFFRDQGLPGYGSVRQTVDTALTTLRVIGSTTYESRRDLGAGGRLRAQLYYLHEQQRYRDPRGEISSAPAATNDRTGTVGFNARLARPFLPWLRGAAVAEARYQLFRSYDGRARPAQGAPSSRSFVAAGVEAELRWSRLRLDVLPSLRLEVARDARAGRSDFAAQLPAGAPRTEVVPVARLALVEHVGGAVTLRANVGRYSRLPSLTELFGDSGFLLGNPALVPESGWNADLGVHAPWQRGRVSGTVDAAGFAALVDQLIQFQQDAYGRARALNIGRARVLGVEASLDLHLGRWGRLGAGATFLDARDVSATSIGRHQPLLPNRPRLHAYARPEVRWPVLAGALVLGAYVDLDVSDGNYVDPANLVELPARFFVGAGVSVEAPRTHLAVVGSAQNLADVRTFDFAGFPLPSRTFFLSARWTLPKENAP